MLRFSIVQNFTPIMYLSIRNHTIHLFVVLVTTIAFSAQAQKNSGTPFVQKQNSFSHSSYLGYSNLESTKPSEKKLLAANFISKPDISTAPSAVDDAYSVDEDNIFTSTIPSTGLLANDTDLDGDNLSVSLVPTIAPQHGLLVLNADGTFSYTPVSDYNGTDSFVYEVCDDAAIQECSTANVTITINSVNDNPVAVNDAAVPDPIEDTPYSGFGLLLNDSDVDAGDLLSVSTTAVSGPLHGTLVLNSDGSYTYSPALNYSGNDSFTYEVCDNGLPIACAQALVSLNIQPVNDAPQALADAYSTAEDQTLNAASVLVNDSDPENDLLSVSVVPLSNVTHGSLLLNSNGTFSYTPAANYNGSDSFEYEVCDNGTPVMCSSALVTLTVNPSNDAPAAVDDAVITNEDVVLNGTSLLANDSDLDGHALTINTTPLVNPIHGNVLINIDGTYTYTPSANYFGNDSFTYQICDNGVPVLCSSALVTVTINPVNDAPVAVADIASTDEDVVLNGTTLLANDSDPEGNLLTVTTSPITAPLHGNLILNSNGTYSYTPFANYSGSDSFVYEVCDNGSPIQCATASVSITVNAIADNPIATNDNYSTNEDVLLNGTSVLVNDSDGDGDLLSVNTTPITNVTNGLLVLNSDGTFIYIPGANFSGSDSFVYEVCDGAFNCTTGTAVITIIAVNDAPIAQNDVAIVAEDAVLNGSSLLSNDSDPESNLLSISTTPLLAPLHGSLLINPNGTYSYTPVSNYNGPDSFVYQVCDNGSPSACASATVSITVNSVNDAPTAIADNVITNEDVVLNGASLLLNDSDVDGNTISISTTPVSAPSFGTLTINSNGTFQYTPNSNFNGTDSFIYRICDNGTPSQCATALVTIAINSVNDSPMALPDAASTAEDNVLIGTSLLTNDSDPDGNALTLSTLPLVNPTHGLLTLNASGTYVYTPTLNYSGTDSFVYEVCDNAAPAACSSALVTITITPVNDAPSLVNDTYTTAEDTPLNGTSILNNDSDLDGNNLVLNTTPVTAPAHGQLTLNSNGTFTYVPDVNYFGSDTFVYSVCDDGSPSLCSTASVTLNITASNDAPIAVNGNYSTSEDVSLNGSSVLTNDSDPDGDLLIINTTPIVNVSSGNLTLNSNGTFTYIPALNFNGTVSFTYEVCDNAIPSLCATAVTTIDVLSVNDAPTALTDFYAINEDTPLNGSSVLTNDFDVELNTISLNTTPIVAPLHGLLLLNSNGTFTYTPFPNYNGPDSFTYEICDNGTPSLCATAVANITINAINDNPIALNDNGSTLENITLNGTTVLANDSDPENGTLTVSTTPISNVSNGILVLNANGTYTYTPNLNYNGFDTFVYQVCDNGTPVACATATVTISIGSVNQFPVATNDAISMNEDTPNSSNVLNNDSDPDLDILTVTAVTNFPTAHGKITLASNGAYTYTPNLNYNGPDSYVYQVCDNGNPSLCSNATININVLPINDAPVAINDNVITPEDVVLNGSSLLINDSDIDGNPLTLNTTPLVSPAHGSLLLNSNGTYTYTPALNYVGGDLFVYEVCDNGTPALCSNAVVLITISAVNDSPTATSDSYTTNEDNVLFGSSVLANDFDQDGNSLSVTGVAITPPLHGNLVLNANGTFIYTPFLNYNGTDSFVYEVCDNAVPSLCASAIVNLTITPINDAPIAVADVATTSEDTPLSGASVLANDTDADGNPITINTTPAVLPLHGTVTINSNGTYLYTPNANYSGSDSFTYQVCDNGIPVLCATAIVSLTVSAVNDPPLAINDFAVTNEDTPLNGTTVLSNDTDPDGNPLIVSINPTVMPSNGVLVLNSNGTYTYTPNLNYNGTDNFTYQVCDNGSPALCSTGQVSITINAVNDAPQPVADVFTVAEDVILNGSNLLNNDTDPEANLLVITTVPVSNPLHGSLTINANGTFVYTPTANYNGPDSFVYQTCDAGIPVACATGVVNITVTPINDAPIAQDDNASTLENSTLNGIGLLTNDSDPDGNPLSILTTPLVAPLNGSLVLNSNGTYTYTPIIGYSGFDSFTYRVCDNGIPALCDDAVVTIGIGAVNHAPQALNDAFSTNENIALNATVASNDSDPDANNLSYSGTIVIQPGNGIVVMNTNGSFTYTPNSGFSGNDGFTYQVCDDGVPSLCATATVSITVLPVNDAPIANADAVTINEDNTISTYNLLNNDTDVDGTSLVISTIPVQTTQHGTLTINSNGTFSFIPDLNYSGTDIFIYQVCDNGTPALCDTATVTITVTAVNDAPSAINDSFVTTMNSVINGNLISNDSDVDGPLLNTSILASVTNGNVVLNPNGAFTYTPTNGFIGIDSLRYILCDGASAALCDTATAYFTINPIPNSSPIANADNYTLTEDAVLTSPFSVLANDTDPDGNNISILISSLILPNNGILNFNANGTFTYTPNSNFNGTDSFEYTLCDDGTPTLCDTAIVILQVTSVNDHPIATIDTAQTLINTIVSGNVLSNDSDDDGPLQLITQLTFPSNGSIVLNTNGSFSYTPNNGFTGSDTVFYSLCDNGIPNLCASSYLVIHVNPLPPNQAPVANPDLVITSEDTQVTGSIASNDSDPEMSTLIYTAFNGSTNHGTIAISTSGNFIYVPAADYFGTDSFIYTVCDTVTPPLCDTALITFTITAVNDAPIAQNDSASILQGTSASGNVLSNDFDVEAASLASQILVLPINGIASLNANGAYTYTPNANFIGTDVFSYVVCDGGTPNNCDTALVVVTVSAPPCAGYIANTDQVVTNEDVQAVTAVLTNDNVIASNVILTIATNPVNGSVNINANNTITYTPGLNFNGTDSYIYTVGRSTGGPSVCDTALVQISILPINDAPLAVNDAFTTSPGNAVNGNVQQNDSDVDDLILNSAVVQPASNGIVNLNSNGIFTYTPNPGFIGVDTFTYSLCDGATPTLCDTAVVTITVSGNLCAGFKAYSDTASMLEDNSVTISVLSNDTVILSKLGMALTTNPQHGIVTLTSNQSFTYVPAANYHGPDFFIYSVTDSTLPGSFICDTAIVQLNVISVNDAPVALHDLYTMSEGQLLSDTVVINDADIDTDTLNVSVVIQPAHGTLQLNTNGTFTYQPNAFYFGFDSFVYNLCESNQSAPLCDTALVRIFISKINKAPQAYNDTATMNQGEVLSRNLLVNDIDPDNNDLLSTNIGSILPAHGALSIQTDGTYLYTPDELYFGLDSFSYSVCDDNLNNKLCDEGMVIITILETPFTIPDAFSPDGDNINDFFVIKRIQAFPNCELKVFNRWGHLVYSKKGYDNSWNGKANIGNEGEGLPSGSYYYTLIFNDGATETKQGYVVLRK
ncbi:MAG TPA: Ig-like domain-containing protein [Bacteroidia bacterium]|nr:Ig-like domain-containing protein [Bacteroidia bacterium]